MMDHDSQYSVKEFPLDSPSLESNETQSRLQSMGYEDKLVPSGRAGDRVSLALSLGGLAIMVIYTWVLVLSNNPTSMKWFAIHPPFQTLAVALFAYGILTLQPTSMSQPKAKARGLSRHQIFMFLTGLPIIAAGTLAIIYNKYDHESSHFTTWHGTLGIIAVVWMLIQIGVGGGSVWFGGRAFGKNPKIVYKYHRASGYLLLALFLLVIHVGGAWSHFSISNGNVAMRVIAYAVAPIAILVGVWSRARLNKIKFF